MKLVALALALALASTASTPAPIAGRWVTDDGKALVVIAACGKGMCGRIVRIPGANHLFQAATTGAMDEYRALEPRFAGAFQKALNDFLIEAVSP